MDRRELISGLTVGIACGLSGCESLSNSSDESDREIHETATETATETEDQTIKSSSEEVPSYYISPIRIFDVRDNTLKLALTHLIPPTDSVEYNLHLQTEPDTWYYEPVISATLGPRTYSETAKRWVSDKFRPVYGSDQPGEHQDTLEVPNIRDINPDEFQTLDIPQRHKSYGQPHRIVTFDIEQPPTGKPFTFQFTADGPGSVDGGHIIGRTPMMLRTPTGEYLYPQIDNPDGVKPAIPKKWATEENRSKLRDRRQNEESGTKITATRYTAYPKWSNRYEEMDERESERWDDGGINSRPTVGDRRKPSMNGDGADSWINSPMQVPWTIDFTLTYEEQEQSRKARPVEIIDDSRYERLNSILRTPEIRNSPSVRKVSKELRHVCDEIVNTQNPLEDIRVVSDYIQNMEYTSQSGPVPKPYDTIRSGHGDCATKSVLMFSILSQPEFGYNPTLFSIPDVLEFTDRPNIGHVAIGVPAYRLGLTEDDIRETGQRDHPIIDGYLYIEPTYPNEIGYQPLKGYKPVIPDGMSNFIVPTVHGSDFTPWKLCNGDVVDVTIDESTDYGGIARYNTDNHSVQLNVESANSEPLSPGTDVRTEVILAPGTYPPEREEEILIASEEINE
ncbi:hypothetical protein [Haloarcula amylolytica]|uniref:hypothetical protein n=1 Tax=Haloarcula amylolytica TaxID=396317 RepID=UPI000A4BBD18|nr:hypothetical protein [Haloarcula amylolytica]